MPTSDDSLPPAGQTLHRAFEALIGALNESKVRYAIIGGLAVIQHARVRTTDDIDVLLGASQIELVRLFETLAERGFEIDLSRSVREFRDDGVTLVRFQGAIVDLLRPVIPAYVHVLDRTIITNVLGLPVQTGSAEGLIVTKLIAMRPQDEADIQEILASYGNQLNLAYIRDELDTFTQPDDPRRAKFEDWVRNVAREI